MRFLNPWHWLSLLTGYNVIGNFLIIASLLAAGSIYYQLQLGRGGYQHKPLVTNAVATHAFPAIPVFTDKPLTDFSAIVQHPLFVISRRPKVVTILAYKPVVNFILTGVIITPDKRFAVFRDNVTDRENRVANGAVHNGWLLEKVEESGVTLRFGKFSKFIKITIKKNPDKSPRQKIRR